MWSLLILTTFAGPVPAVTWHPTRAACEQQAAVEVTALALAGRPVSAVLCERHDVPRMRAATGEVLR